MSKKITCDECDRVIDKDSMNYIHLALIPALFGKVVNDIDFPANDKDFCTTGCLTRWVVSLER